MAIIQQNNQAPNTVVSIDEHNTAQLVVAAFNFPGGHCAGDTIDLTSFQGGPVRVYFDQDGTLSLDLYRDYYWLLAECILPDRRYDQVDSGQVDPNGQPIMRTVEKLLNLQDIGITVFPLPREVI